MRQSKRELYRQIEELDDEHDEGPARIEIHETVIGSGHGGDSANAGDVVDEETTVIEL
jgi:hypothetical protein